MVSLKLHNYLLSFVFEVDDSHKKFHFDFVGGGGVVVGVVAVDDEHFRKNCTYVEFLFSCNISSYQCYLSIICMLLHCAVRFIALLTCTLVVTLW